MTLRNRIVLAPLCQYAAENGFAGDWHLVHLGKFALGGFGVVMTEATAIEARGRVSHGDIGIWSDDFIPGLKRIADFVRAQGAAPAIQIAHAGRKAGWQRPWQGNRPLGPDDALRGEPPFAVVGPTDEPVGPDFVKPHELTLSEIEEIVSRFGDAAARARAAGFDVLEIHGGHGYLISSFLSPGINTRKDAYGGDRARRMRFGLEVLRAVREHWPMHKPLFFRISAVDGAPDGWAIDDSVAFATRLKDGGVDVVDCSSGGMCGSTTLENARRGPGYQVKHAADVRRGAGIATMAVGLILDGDQAESILEAGDADLIGVGRQAMYDPYWPHHVAQDLRADPLFAAWAEQSGWWLARRAEQLAGVGYGPDGRLARLDVGKGK